MKKPLLIALFMFAQTLWAQEAHLRANNLFNQGRQNQAAALTDSLLSLSPDDPVLLLLKGRVEIARQRYTEAVPALGRLVANDSTHITGLCALGQAYQEQGLVPEAIDAYRQALIQGPDRRDLVLKLAALYAKRDAFLTVAALLRPLAKQEDQNPLFFSLLAKSLIELDAHAEAIRWARRGLELDSLNYPNLLNLGLAYFEKGRSDSAIGPLRLASKVSPKSDAALYFLGESLCKQDRVDEAVIAHEKCVEIGGPYQLRSLKMLPKLYYNQQALESCIQAANMYLKHKPDEAFVHHFKARAEADLGLLDEADRSFIKALRHSNQDFIKMTYFYQALNAYQGERYPQAIKGYRTVLALDPLFGFALYNLAVTYDRFYQDKSTALDHYQRFLDLAKTQETDESIVMAAKERLRTLKSQNFMRSSAQ